MASAIIPYGHGHNYIVEVTAGGQVDPQTGMVCDMVKLDDVVSKKIVSRFDHTNLNLDASFRDVVPTTENLCIAIHKQACSRFSPRGLGRGRSGSGESGRDEQQLF